MSAQEVIPSSNPGRVHPALKLEVTEVKNGTPEQVESAIIGLLNEADDNIILCTSLHPQFYNRELISKSIQKVVEQIRSFRILLDSHTNIQQVKEELPWLFELKNKGKIEIAQSDQPIPHWLMIDRKHFRFEKPHSPSMAGKDNLIVKNADMDEKIYLIIEDVISDIDRLWEEARPVTPQ